MAIVHKASCRNAKTFEDLANNLSEQHIDEAYKYSTLSTQLNLLNVSADQTKLMLKELFPLECSLCHPTSTGSFPMVKIKRIL